MKLYAIETCWAYTTRMLPTNPRISRKVGAIDRTLLSHWSTICPVPKNIKKKENCRLPALADLDSKLYCRRKCWENTKMTSFRLSKWKLEPSSKSKCYASESWNSLLNRNVTRKSNSKGENVFGQSVFIENKGRGNLYWNERHWTMKATNIVYLLILFRM